MPQIQAHLADIRRSVALLFPPEGITELRAPKSDRDGVLSGYFSDPEKLVQAALAVNGRAPGVYITLNPSPHDRLERANNKIRSQAPKTTGDAEVLHRRWLLIDLDPKRPSEVSSTDEEHGIALDTTRAIRDALTRAGWPMPIYGDSGNGGHLLYRIDLPNTPESAALIKAVLQSLSARYTTRQIVIDTTVHNASRISKIYGTLARKGTSTEDRPHRVSRLLDVPEDIQPVSIELLAALAAETQIAPPPVSSNHHSASDFTLESFISRNGIAIKSGPDPWEGGERWVLPCCPFNPEHKAKDAAIFRHASGRLGFRCFHNSCANNHWEEFRDLYEPSRPKAPRASNGHAPSHALPAAPALPVPQAATATINPEPEELAITKYDALQALDVLLSEVVDSKEAHRIYGTKEASAPYIVALAHCPRSAWERTKATLAETFKDEFRPRRWDIELKEEVDKLQKSIVSTPKEGWESELILKSTFTPAPCVTNALLYFNNHADWAGKLAWNEFTGEPVVKDDLPFPVSLRAGEPVKDHHDTLVQSWLERVSGDPKWNIDTVRRSVDCWAKANSFHPVKDYLNGLPEWDGIERLPSWLSRYCGAGPSETDDSPESVDLAAFVSAIGERWWISAIARIFQPGCEVHHVLVLEGSKGLGKSTLVRIIFGEWSGFIVGDVATKDSQALLSSGVWGLELDELGVLDKSGMRAIKSWVTRPFENFRPTWGHRHEKRQRQVVFIATVDRADWADEEDRRWWPVLCQREFDLAALKVDRDMLMAEALFKYNRGDRWHFDRKEDEELIVVAQQEQAARVPEDTWAGIVRRALSAAHDSKNKQRIGSRAGVFVSKEEILDRLPEKYQINRDQAGNRVGRAMKSIPKWSRVQVSIGDERPWRYFLPSDKD